MKRALILIAVGSFIVSANAQNVLTRKEIYRVNCKAIVQISVNGRFSGVGFIVSADGFVMTANHVITTRESKLREYVTDIKVAVFGRPIPYAAKPVTSRVSDDQANYDSTLIKIEAANLPKVTLGDLAEVDIGDSVTIIPSFPGVGCILLDGTIAAMGPYQTAFGPKPVNTVFFQSPIRNGFSGSPVFDPRGHVVGIEDTKVFGISPVLDELRTKWMERRKQVSVTIGGVDVSGSFLELINNLDQNLISGLGSGVDISYAKEQNEKK